MLPLTCDKNPPVSTWVADPENSWNNILVSDIDSSSIMLFSGWVNPWMIIVHAFLD
jgi:hypothetical protein